VRPVSAEEHAAVVPVGVAPRIDLPARLRSFLRRREVVSPSVLRFGDLTLDPDSRAVRRGRRTIELTPIEFNLLELFLQHPRSVLTRSSIFAAVWGFDFGVMSNSLNVYVGSVRRKTEAAGEPRLIQTIRGVGYVLREP
jgi:two-component system response regulator MprA